MLAVNSSPLIIPTDELVQWIERSIDPRDLTTWLFRAYPGPGLAKIAWPTGFPVQRKVQINRLIWPSTASRWAYMTGLIDAQNLSLLQLQAFDNDGLGFNSVTLRIASYNVNDNAYEDIKTKMFLLPPIPLSRVVISSDLSNPFLPDAANINNLYLIQLVDQRFFWWSYSTGDIKTDGKIWRQMFDAIGSILGVTINVDTIDPSYLFPSRVLDTDYEVVPPYLDALASNVGQRICVTLDNNVYSQNFATARQMRLNDDQSHSGRTTRAGSLWYNNTLTL